MHRKLTITVADDVYQGLHRTVGRGQISRFIEDFVRPHVGDDDELETAYREMAADEESEREALEWIEAHVDEGRWGGRPHPAPLGDDLAGYCRWRTGPARYLADRPS